MQPPPITVSDAPAAFHLLAKPTGAICNLDCEYCFFLSKEKLCPGMTIAHSIQTNGTLLAPAAGVISSATKGTSPWISH